MSFMEQSKQKNAPLKDKTFVFTGEMQMDREEAKRNVIMLGGRVTIAPSSKTDFLVAGDEPGPSKMETARKLGIKIIDESTFLKTIEKNQEKFEDTFQIQQNSNEVVEKIIWTEKWRPKLACDFVGNTPIINELKDFLKYKSEKNAALLSGPPGCGKTTMATFVAKELNFEILEFNASDLRNKSEIVKNIKGGIFFDSISTNCKMQKKVLIMDEIDGMSSDRGGIPELVNLIKNTKIKIICICNDRYHPKIRTLANYCIDLRFRKLTSSQILPRIKQILAKEDKKLPDNILNEVIITANGDLRYILNTLQTISSRKEISHHQISLFVKKTAMKSLFELGSEIFHKKKISEKMEVYFEDYSMIPLFVYENYINVKPKSLESLYLTAESISLGDLIDKKIHGPDQMWHLAPYHGFYSSIEASKDINLNKKLEFPTFLGQNSKFLKNKRNIGKMLKHGFKHFNTDISDFKELYLYTLFKLYTNFVDKNDISSLINLLVKYDLLKEDFEVLFELFPETQQIFKSTATKFKSAYTREYKKLNRNLPDEIELQSEEENVEMASIDYGEE